MKQAGSILTPSTISATGRDQSSALPLRINVELLQEYGVQSPVEVCCDQCNEQWALCARTQPRSAAAMHALWNIRKQESQYSAMLHVSHE